MKEQNSLDFKRKKRYISSWAAAVPAFLPFLETLRSKASIEDENHVLINVSSGKYVYHCQDGGFDYAYKTQQGKTFWRYMLRASLPLRECYHYEVLESLDIPVPQVLAVGDTRRFFVLKESFLITSFLADTHDGRIFMEGGKFRSGYEAIRSVYCRKNLVFMAKLHDAGYFHKAAHPRNFLFRGETPEALEVFWIDVARMRKAKDIRKAVIMDLHTFFRDMRLPRQEVLDLIGFYLETVKCKQFQSADEVLELLVNFKRRAFSKRKYKLFAE